MPGGGAAAGAGAGAGAAAGQGLEDLKRGSKSEKCHPFHREKVDPDQLPPDYIALLSLVFGIMGLMLKYKWCAWLSVFFCMESIANMKTTEVDMKQILCSVMFAFMGLFMNYFGPPAR